MIEQGNKFVKKMFYEISVTHLKDYIMQQKGINAI